jgi:hypothetical protein
MKRLYSSFFIYNSDGGEPGGGGAEEQLPTGDETQGQQQQTTTTPQVETPSPQGLLTQEELAAYGFQTADELKIFLQKQKEAQIPEEEKQRLANLEKAEFFQTAAQSGFNIEDLTKYESVKTKADAELVFEKFVADFKEENPDIEESELEDAAKLAFDDEYKLSSDNEKAKQRGLKRLERDAKELRSPMETVYQKAKSIFEEQRQMKTVFPEYNKFIESVINENTPDKVVLFQTKDGEDEIAVDTEITKEQREEIAKLFKNEKTFAQYLNDKQSKEELGKKIAKKIEGYIRQNNFETAVKKAYETGVGIGTKRGSTVGAENLFGVAAQSKGGTAEIKNLSLEESNKRIAEARSRYKP